MIHDTKRIWIHIVRHESNLLESGFVTTKRYKSMFLRISYTILSSFIAMIEQTV